MSPHSSVERISLKLATFLMLALPGFSQSSSRRRSMGRSSTVPA